MAQHQSIPMNNRILKRRSQRLVLSIPVVGYKVSKAARSFFEGVHTLTISAHGALISFATEVAADQKLILRHVLSGEEQECRVVFVQKKLGGPTEVGIEFRRPAPNFWGIPFAPADWKRPQLY